MSRQNDKTWRALITGTDTDVGKTEFSCHLLSQARALGWRTAAMKPIASGAEMRADGLRNADAERLRDAAFGQASSLDYALLNPYCFAQAIAPHIAADLNHQQPELTHIKHCFAQIANDKNFVLVEGAGGWLSPLSHRIDHRDLAQALDLPVVLVVPMRLGCIHQARATLRAIQQDGITCLGFVANIWPNTMPYLPENLSALKHYLDAPCLGHSIEQAVQQILAT